jgi:hypothetical protein
MVKGPIQQFYIYTGETRRHRISFGRLDAAWVITKIVGCNGSYYICIINLEVIRD